MQHLNQTPLLREALRQEQSDNGGCTADQTLAYRRTSVSPYLGFRAVSTKGHGSDHEIQRPVPLPLRMLQGVHWVAVA